MNRPHSLIALAVLLTCLAAVSWPAMTQGTEDQEAEQSEEYHQIIDSFFTLLEQQKPGGALDYIYDTNLNLDNIKNQLAQKRIRFIMDMEAFGHYQDHVIAIEREFGGLYSYHYVIAICDLRPVKMEFHFYKPKQRWRLHTFTYSGEVDKDIAGVVKYELAWPTDHATEGHPEGDPE